MNETARILNHFTAPEDFLKKVRATFGSWIPCPDCLGEGKQKQDCECYPFNPNGCELCDHKGWTPIDCPTCKHSGNPGSVWMTNDDVEKIWEDRG